MKKGTIIALVVVGVVVVGGIITAVVISKKKKAKKQVYRPVTKEATRQAAPPKQKGKTLSNIANIVESAAKIAEKV